MQFTATSTSAEIVANQLAGDERSRSTVIGQPRCRATSHVCGLKNTNRHDDLNTTIQFT
jgi:hypothetical protein